MKSIEFMSPLQGAKSCKSFDVSCRKFNDIQVGPDCRQNIVWKAYVKLEIAHRAVWHPQSAAGPTFHLAHLHWTCMFHGFMIQPLSHLHTMILWLFASCNVSASLTRYHVKATVNWGSCASSAVVGSICDCEFLSSLCSAVDKSKGVNQGFDEYHCRHGKERREPCPWRDWCHHTLPLSLCGFAGRCISHQHPECLPQSTHDQTAQKWNDWKLVSSTKPELKLYLVYTLSMWCSVWNNGAPGLLSTPALP